jgi:hypothetical protein
MRVARTSVSEIGCGDTSEGGRRSLEGIRAAVKLFPTGAVPLWVGCVAWVGQAALTDSVPVEQLEVDQPQIPPMPQGQYVEELEREVIATDDVPSHQELIAEEEEAIAEITGEVETEEQDAIAEITAEADTEEEELISEEELITEEEVEDAPQAIAPEVMEVRAVVPSCAGYSTETLKRVARLNAAHGGGVEQALDDLAQEVVWLNNELPGEAPAPAAAAATATPPTPGPSSVASQGRASVASRFVPAASARVRTATPLQTQLDQVKAGGCTVKLWRMGDVGATAPKLLYKVKKSYRQWDQVRIRRHPLERFG